MRHYFPLIFRFHRLWRAGLAAILLAAAQLAGAQTATIAYLGAASGYTPGSGISYIGAGSSAIANGGGTTCPYPAGWQAGDMLLCVIEAHDTGGISMDGSWTSAISRSTTRHSAAVFWKIAAAGDNTAPTVSHTGAGVIVARMVDFRGVDNANPIEGTPATSSTSNDDSTTIPAFSTTVANSVAVFTLHTDTSGSGLDGAGGWTRAFSTSTTTGNDATLEAWYRTYASTGNRSSDDVDLDDDADSIGGLIVLRPASGGTCVTVAAPANTVEGSVMVASVAATPQTVTLTAPTGWTQILGTTQTQGNGGDGGLLVSYYKVATGSEPGAYAWCTTSTDSDLALSAGIASFSGVSTTSPINASGGSAGTANTASQTAPSITTTTSNAMLVGSYMLVSAYNWTPPAGMTEAVDRPSATVIPDNSGVSLGMDYATQASSGATGIRTATAASSAHGAAQLIALTPASIVSTPPGPFNAVEHSASPVTGKIYTKTTGSPFALDVATLNAARTAATAWSGNVKIELLAYATTPAGTWGGANGCPPASGQTVILAQASQSLSGNVGGVTANVSFPGVANAYPYAIVRITYPATGTATTVSCSSDAFAIKPATLSIVAQDADWATAGTARTLNATASATATPVHKAGQPFALTATAYNAASPAAVTTNYAATSLMPYGTAAVAVNTNSPGGLTTGTFDGGAFSGNGGVLVSTTASYSEVGIVSLQLADQAFAQIDNGDGTPGSCTGWWVCSPAVSIGRFVPDHFSVSVTPFCSAATAFTYSGQPFKNVTVTALNASGGTTQNYNMTSGFSQSVTLSDVSTATPDANGSWNGTNGIAASTFLLTPTPGAATTTSPAFTFVTQPLAPKTLQVRATDSDGVSSSGYDSVTAAEPLVRFGRLRLFNAYGAVGTTLNLPVQAQYWSADGVWVQNSDDSCSTLAPGNVYLASSAVAVKSGTSTIALSGGAANLPLTTTSATTISSGVAINLGAGGSTQSCLSSNGSATGANKAWLRSLNGNCAATYDRDPSAQATFGIFSAESRRVIHMREAFW